MTLTRVTALAERLSVPPDRLAALDGCEEVDLARLEAAVARAFEAEDAAVDKAFADAVKLVPRPLRGRAAKLLFPEGHHG